MRTKSRLVSSLALMALAGALALAAPPASAMMGGGDSGGSSSAPRIDPAKAYQDGVTALNAHDYKTAISRFKEVVDAAPRDPDANYALGLAYIGSGDAKSARRPLERAVRADNAPPDAFLQLGLVDLQLGKRDDAEDQQKALSELIAKCDAQCGPDRKAKLQAAFDALKQALESGATPGKPTTGWNLPSVPEARALYAKAQGLINQERYVEALTILTQARSAIGPDVDILNALGFVSRHLQRYDAALAYYGQALALNPQHIGATEYLGELYVELGRREDARKQLAKLDALCPYGCEAREELARRIDRVAAQ